MLRNALAAGLTIRVVLADAGHADATAFHAALPAAQPAYAVGIAWTTSVSFRTPQFHAPTGSAQVLTRRHPRPAPAKATRRCRSAPWPWRCRGDASPGAMAPTHRARPASPPAADPCSRFAAAPGARRAAPARTWPRRPVDDKFVPVHLPLRTSLVHLVTLAFERLAIEKNYQQLNTELGLDHLERRTYPGWDCHVALTAIAYAFLQRGRMTRDPAITFETIPAIVREAFTRLIYALYPRYRTWLTDTRATLPLRP